MGSWKAWVPRMAESPSTLPDRGDRGDRDLREIRFEPGVSPHAEGSCLVSFGGTKVLCTASVEETVPEWRQGSGLGWVTAEYGMLPRSTHTRRRRERNGAGGRTSEIQRLIGRSLRSICDLSSLGERMVILDCDVLQADGGTRTAAVTGGFVALALALRGLKERGTIDLSPIRDEVAAVSVGLLDARPRLDLDYSEDVRAQVDMNVVGTGRGEVVEIQGTAEGAPFRRAELDALVDLAMDGIRVLTEHQRRLLESGNS